MMLQRLDAGELLGCLIGHIEEKTGLRCYDTPDNVESPLYGVQLVRIQPENTKTMFRDNYQVWIHCISAPTFPFSNAPVLGLVRKLEEAMTVEVEIPSRFYLQRQEYGGLQTLKEDETGEGHAVLSYDFHICWGFRCK